MDNMVDNKTKAFAVRIVRFYKYLTEEKKENVLAKQILMLLFPTVPEGASYINIPMWTNDSKWERNRLFRCFRI